MEKRREHKWLYMILALLAAVVLWLYVSNERNQDMDLTIRNIPVTFTGLERLEERGLLITEGAEQTVTLNVRTNWRTAGKLSRDTISISVDVSNVTAPGPYNTGYKINYPVSSSSVSTIGSEQSVQYVVARRIERPVEIRGQFNGDVAEGFQLGEFSIAPGTVTVSGQEELVNQVEYALVTVNGAGAIKESFTDNMSFELIGSNGEVLDAEKLNLEMDVDTVQVTLPVVKLKEVELTVDVVSGGGAARENAEIKIEPSHITLSGSEEDLARIDKINLGEIDLQTIYDEESLSLPIPVSNKVENVSGITEAKVKVKIDGLTTRSLEVGVDEIQFFNRPEGCAVEAMTQSVQVEIRGEADAVGRVLPSQLRIRADLSDAVMGSQTIPVEVDLNGEDNVGVVGTSYRIVVNIKRE